MSKFIVIEHNATTGEVIEREMTAEEQARKTAEIADSIERKAKAEAQLAAKEAAQNKLATLGLTPQDIKALGF